MTLPEIFGWCWGSWAGSSLPWFFYAWSQPLANLCLNTKYSIKVSITKILYLLTLCPRYLEFVQNLLFNRLKRMPKVHIVFPTAFKDFQHLNLLSKNNIPFLMVHLLWSIGYHSQYKHPMILRWRIQHIMAGRLIIVLIILLFFHQMVSLLSIILVK